MSSMLDLARKYPDIFRRITLDEIDIIAKGEKPKHNYFIYLEDVDEIVKVIQGEKEEVAVEFIATKIYKVGE